jgi:hypothetical protein
MFNHLFITTNALLTSVAISRFSALSSLATCRTKPIRFPLNHLTAIRRLSSGTFIRLSWLDRKGSTPMTPRQCIW